MEKAGALFDAWQPEPGVGQHVSCRGENHPGNPHGDEEG